MIYQMDEFVIYGSKRVGKDFSLATFTSLTFGCWGDFRKPMMMKINAVEAQYKGTNATIIKINTDENASSKDIAKFYNVTTAPTTIFMHNGKTTDRFDYYNAYFRNVELSTLRNAVGRARNSP